MAGYFSADRQRVLGNEEETMAERKGYHDEEPKTEMKGAKKGMLKQDQGKKEGRKSSRKSSRK